MAGVYIGWPVPAERAVQDNVLIPHPGLYWNSATRDNAAQILMRGLTAKNRNEIHFPPLRTTNRQAAYVGPFSVRKTHIVAIDGATAAQAGVKFFVASNEAITSEGIGGHSPRWGKLVCGMIPLLGEGVLI